MACTFKMGERQPRSQTYPISLFPTMYHLCDDVHMNSDVSYHHLPGWSVSVCDYQ